MIWKQPSCSSVEHCVAEKQTKLTCTARLLLAPQKAWQHTTSSELTCTSTS